MTAPAPTTMCNVFDNDGRYLGVVFARGQSGFEAFDASEISLGLFGTAKRAANALLVDTTVALPGEP